MKNSIRFLRRTEYLQQKSQGSHTEDKTEGC